jgi:hypothetical protein
MKWWIDLAKDPAIFPSWYIAAFVLSCVFGVVMFR